MTINEIAALAGVSKSTVSRVINSSSGVSEQTRKNVLRIIKKYNYIPSAMARGLPNKTSNAIGWILPEVDNDFFGQITQGIYEALANTQYYLILSCTQNDFGNEMKALRSMRQQNICGLLITTSAGYVGDKNIEKAKKVISDMQIPVVMIDRSIKNNTWCGIYSDNYNGAYESTEALIKAGCSEIGGFFCDMTLDLGSERYNGFKKAVLDNNLEEKLVYLQDGPAIASEFYEITCQIIDEGRLPKAFFLSNSVIAGGFFKAIIERGIEPGKDIHCMGFDYMDALDIAKIPYSYLKRNCKLFGETAAKVLMQSFKENLHVREEYIVPAALHLDETLR